VVDTSGSIKEFEPPGVDNVELIKTYLRDLVKPPIEIGQYFDHVGMVAFESTARTLFDLDQRTTLDSVIKGIDTLLPYPNGETNTPDAINLALQVGGQWSVCLPSMNALRLRVFDMRVLEINSF